ncbi:hypothetical protein HMPREF1146_0048 [Prevotella sp. MSX73]|nr:hypothetical protein HMPREF1146_0048 [Prevotella sp. MSX73]
MVGGKRLKGMDGIEKRPDDKAKGAQSDCQSGTTAGQKGPNGLLVRAFSHPFGDGFTCQEKSND